jgi:hypothetical protein
MQARPLDIWKNPVVVRPYIQVAMGDKLRVIFLVNSVEQISPLWEDHI